MGAALWTCDGCGRTFANRNQTHTCAPLGDLEDHSRVRTRRCGPRSSAFWPRSALRAGGGNTFRVSGPEQVDETILALLTEA